MISWTWEDDDRGVGALHRWWLAQLRRAQRGLDLPGLRRDVAAVRPAQRGGDLRAVTARARAVGVRRAAQQLQSVGRVQVREGLQRGGEELPQRRAQPQHMPGPVPDQALMRPGDQLDRLGQRRVPGDRPVMGVVQPDDLGQHVRVPSIGLRPGRGVPFPVAGHRHRVDREHLIPGRDQRGNPRARGRSRSRPSPARQPRRRAGRAHSSGRWPAISACSRRHPLQPLGQPPAASRRPCSSTISMSWWSSAQSSPTNIITRPPAPVTGTSQQRGGDSQRSNSQVLTAARPGHVIPSAVTPPHDQRAHGLPQDLQGPDE